MNILIEILYIFLPIQSLIILFDTDFSLLCLQKPLRASNNEGKVSEVYEYSVSDSYVAPKNDFSKLEAVSDSLKKMSLEKESSLKVNSTRIQQLLM